MNKDQKPIVSAIIIAGVLIAGAILLKDSKPPVDTNLPMVGNTVSGTPRPVSLEDDHIFGDLNAKVVIVEYSDLECPFCKVFHETMHKVVNETDDVAWVFRHYPIPQLHAKAFAEAEATECAWEQGGNDAFWQYTDKIFEITPSNDGLEESQLPEIAKAIGLDVDAFNACLESGKFAAKIQADIDDGNQAGVSGTPSSFIFVDGELVDTIEGALTYPMVKQKLDAVLK